MSYGLVQPLPLAGKVGTKRRVGALSTLEALVAEGAPTPALPRKRERERTSLIAASGSNLIVL